MSESKSTNLYIPALLTGGLTLGSGIIMLINSFGLSEGVGFNEDLATVGFSGISDISLLSAGDFSIPLIAVGALILIFANATAWRATGGY